MDNILYYQRIATGIEVLWKGIFSLINSHPFVGIYFVDSRKKHTWVSRWRELKKNILSKFNFYLFRNRILENIDDIRKNLLKYLFVSTCNLHLHFVSKNTNAVGQILLLLGLKHKHELLVFVLGCCMVCWKICANDMPLATLLTGLLCDCKAVKSVLSKFKCRLRRKKLKTWFL